MMCMIIKDKIKINKLNDIINILKKLYKIYFIDEAKICDVNIKLKK